MKFVVVAGRVARWPWSPGGIVRDLCAGLVEAGHNVVLVAHSVDDMDELQARCVPNGVARNGVRGGAQSAHTNAFCARALEPYVEHHTHWPTRRSIRGGMTRMILQELNQPTTTDAVITTTHLVGPLWHDSWAKKPLKSGWLPVEPDARSWLASMLRTRWNGWDLRSWRSALSIAAALARHRGILRMFLQSSRHSTTSKKLLNSRSVKALQPGGYAPTARHTTHKSDRIQARRAMSIGDGKLLLLVSCPASPPMGVGPGFIGLLRGCARVVDRVRAGELGRGIRTPVLLVLTSQPFLVHQAVVESRMLGSLWGAGGDAARLLGVTHRMEVALAAADAVVMLPGLVNAPSNSESAERQRGVHGRLACDALAAGKALVGAASRTRNAALWPLRKEIERECLLSEDSELVGGSGEELAGWSGLLERALRRDAAEVAAGKSGLGLSAELVASVRARVGIGAWTARVVQELGEAVGPAELEQYDAGP